MKDVIDILNRLEKYFPDAKCELNFTTPFELLVATVLSAQNTDKNVNKVTKELFKTHNKPQDYANMAVEDLAKLIYSCGFYNNKAKTLIRVSMRILYEYNGKVPSRLSDLYSLLGRKTANVVYANAFGGAAIAVDTHVNRVSKRIGLSKGATPKLVEQDLCKQIPQEMWSKSHTLLIALGRYVCKAQRACCDLCPLCSHCDYYKENYVQDNQQD